MSGQARVGDRVQIDRHRATIRYVGEVAGQEGQWIGLEWDDASRGKHDGSASGHQYFRCLQSGNAGSFVRGSKFDQVADYGQDLPAALSQRCVNHRSDCLPTFITLQSLQSNPWIITRAHCWITRWPYSTSRPRCFYLLD
jgi:hypothetical protein